MAKYSMNILWSEEDKGFIATIPEFPSLSAFGETYEDALKEAQSALEGYIAVFSEEGEKLPDPNTVNNYSGQTRIRMPRELHRHLAIESARQNMSLNSYMVSLLSMNFIFNRFERLEKESQQYHAGYEYIGSSAVGSYITQGRSVAYLGNVGIGQKVPFQLSGGGR